MKNLVRRPSDTKRRSTAQSGLSDSVASLTSCGEIDWSTGTPEDQSGGCMRYRTHQYSLKQEFRTSRVSEKSVTFGDVQIRTHLITLGDNPAVSGGAPVALSNELLDDRTIGLDRFEAARPERRHKREMVIPRSTREDWLRDVGYPRSLLNDATAQAKLIRDQRAKSANDGQTWERMKHLVRRSRKNHELDRSRAMALATL